MFCWVNGTPNDDGGTIIVPAGQTTGYWQRIYSGPMDIRWFGAVPGDQSTNTPPTAFDVGGTHNDYKVGSLLQWTLATQSKCGDAIQKAIIAAHQKGGGQVFIPAGTWYIYGYLRLLDGVELVGAGRMSVLKSMSTSPPGRGTATEFFSADPRRRLVETLGMRSATSRSTAVFWRGASQAASISATTWLSTRRLGPRSLPSWTT